jgi:hypothetical protein
MMLEINISMKTFQARVYVRNGNSRVPHTVQFQAQSSFAAQQMCIAQYGAGNVISIPTEVKNPKGGGSSPWMIKIG